jgi:SAM-dependent methyltransferase
LASAERIAALLLLALVVACSCPEPVVAALRGGAQPAPHHATGHHGAAHGGAHGEAAHAPLGHRFERAEEWVSVFEAPDRDPSQKPALVVATMAIEPGMTVADVGTGTGYFLPHLSPAVGDRGRVLAIDIEPSMVRFVKARAAREKWSNVEARLALTDDPLLAPQSVHRVLVVNTWHHIPERESYAAKLALALAPQGSLWIVDFKLDSPRGPPRAHRLAPSLVARELEQAGFVTRIDTSLLSDQYLVIGRLDPSNKELGTRN